jgi:hypothetical protein
MLITGCGPSLSRQEGQIADWMPPSSERSAETRGQKSFSVRTRRCRSRYPSSMCLRLQAHCSIDGTRPSQAKSVAQMSTEVWVGAEVGTKLTSEVPSCPPMSQPNCSYPTGASCLKARDMEERATPSTEVGPTTLSLGSFFFGQAQPARIRRKSVPDGSCNSSRPVFRRQIQREQSQGLAKSAGRRSNETGGSKLVSRSSNSLAELVVANIRRQDLIG